MVHRDTLENMFALEEALPEKEEPLPEKGTGQEPEGQGMEKHGGFPHRISATINNEKYETLRRQSESHGYDISLVARWMLIPSRVEKLQRGNLESLEGTMRRPLYQGVKGGERKRGKQRNFWLTDAEFELVTRAAAKRGLIRSAYVAATIHEQIGLADSQGWPLPDGITNASVDAEAKNLLRKMEESASEESTGN